MEGFGWQEVVIIAFIMLIFVSPVLLSPFWLPFRPTKRQAHAIAAAGAIAATVLGGLGYAI